MEKIPVINVFTDGSMTTFKCPYCKVWHTHGKGEGHRTSHCYKDKTEFFKETGYRLTHYNKNDLKRIIRLAKQMLEEK